jgi:predicted transposase/invertase (TIGR01784 family)
MTFVMRKHFRIHLQQEIRKIIHNLNLLETKSQRPFVLHLLQYILHVGNKNTSTNELIRILQEEMSPSLEKEMTSVAEDLMEQGRQEGWQKGKQEGWQKGKQEGWHEAEWQTKREMARKMLIENSDPVFVMKVTGFSFAEVQALQKECREGSAVNESPA